MIRHIVMWRLQGDTFAEREAAAEFVKKSFEALRGRIPGMLRLEVGVDISTVDYACDAVLVSDFESQQTLDAYAIHPEHLSIRQQLGAIRIARHQVDYLVADGV